jgi:hypothetical protein
MGPLKTHTCELVQFLSSRVLRIQYSNFASTMMSIAPIASSTLSHPVFNLLHRTQRERIGLPQNSEDHARSLRTFIHFRPGEIALTDRKETSLCPLVVIVNQHEISASSRVCRRWFYMGCSTGHYQRHMSKHENRLARPGSWRTPIPCCQQPVVTEELQERTAALRGDPMGNPHIWVRA